MLSIYFRHISLDNTYLHVVYLFRQFYLHVYIFRQQVLNVEKYEIH